VAKNGQNWRLKPGVGGITRIRAEKSQERINVEDDRTETYAHFASRGMDAIERQEAIIEPSVGTVPVLLRYRVGFSTALVPQLQLWHLHWLVSAQAVSEATFTCFIVVYTSCPTELLLCSSEHIIVRMESSRKA
jgi:hypothetical protein